MGSRSAKDALNELNTLQKRGINFLITKLNIDTTTTEGHFVEFERRTLSRRTKEGLAATRLRGVRLGRPPKLSDAQPADARRRIAGEEKISDFAEPTRLRRGH